MQDADRVAGRGEMDAADSWRLPLPGLARSAIMMPSLSVEKGLTRADCPSGQAAESGEID